LGRLSFHVVAVDFSASDAKRIVKLARDEEHEDCQSGLDTE
jgi:hypothetical protein